MDAHLEFWDDVKQMQNEILAQCAQQTLQRAPDCVYVTSVKIRQNGMTNGRVCGAQIKLAAQRIVEGTHRLSSDSEIARHQDEQAAKREEMKALEAAQKNQVAFAAPPPAPTVAKSGGE
jgi:hypothetical protein